MNFESKFLDKFHKESEFPTPRPLSMKRRKSFSGETFHSLKEGIPNKFLDKKS